MRKALQPKLLAFLLTTFIFSISFAQERRIAGTVTDNEQAPLVGATITVKGTRIFSITDATGKFTISVPSNARTLVVSYVGMDQQEMVIGNNSALTISLSPTTGTLSDVVVVGYGKANRANLTSAQTTVSAKEIDRTINTTIEQAIQGRAAGVYITQNSGQPGGGISVNIRGISSINGNTQPLYVVDGVQIQPSAVSFGSQSSANSIAGINTADIDNVEILQGPSATAIYGSRGTNGVILITTKRGKPGLAKLNYMFQHTIQTPPRRLEVMNLQQYAEMVRQFHVVAGGTTPGEFLDPSLLGSGTDWQRELFNNAPMSKHQLSLSGGMNNTNYYISTEYLKQQGVAVGSGFDRFGVRVNLDTKPREWISFGVNLNYNQTKEDLTTSQENIISNALQLTPQVPVKNLNGSWGGSDPINGANQYAPVNPIAIASFTTNNSIRRQLLGGINLQITPFKGLAIRTSFNGNIGNGNSTYYIPTYNIDQWHYNTVASLQSGTNSNYYWNWNQLIEYTRQIGDHNFGIMASHEAQESEWKQVVAGRTGFLTNDVFDVNAGNPSSATNSGGTYPWAMESYLGRLNYNYDNRYILTATVRRDGSVNFGPDKRWGTFPSLSVAWRINNEKFFNIPAISDLKIRLETGLTGNQGGGSGIYSPLSTGATTWGAGFLPSVYSNPILQWEETKTNNIGINVGFLQNRFTVEADYYVKNTDNLLMPQSLPWYMGTNGSPGSVSPPTVNAGSLETKGWNLSFNTININKKDFKWETNLNFSHFKTIITGLNSDNAFFERTSWWMNNWTQRSQTGYEPWLFRGYIEEGLFQSLEEIQNSPVPVDNTGARIPIDERNGLWVGDVKYRDINGDKKIDVNDMTNIGNPWPKLFGGFTNSFSYKGFDLSILITATFGNDIYNYLAAANSNPNNINVSRNLLIQAMDYAKVSTDGGGKPIVSNRGTTVPRISYGPNGNYAKITNRFVEDGSFVRLKNISLSYSLPEGWLQKTKIVKGLRATIGAQNVFTITDYSGFDPEVGAYVGRDASSANQAIGIDFGRYPLTPIYTFTVSVNF